MALGEEVSQGKFALVVNIFENTFLKDFIPLPTVYQLASVNLLITAS